MQNITPKQINYITHLFHGTEIYKDFPKTNERHPDPKIDNRNMILYDGIKTLNSMQASSLIEDLLNGNEESVKQTLLFIM